jgi:hypothetical protein
VILPIIAEISGLRSGPGPDLEMPQTTPELHQTPMWSTVWPEGPNRTQSRFRVQAKLPLNWTALNHGNPNWHSISNFSHYTQWVLLCFRCDLSVIHMNFSCIQFIQYWSHSTILATLCMGLFMKYVFSFPGPTWYQSLRLDLSTI